MHLRLKKNTAFLLHPFLYNIHEFKNISSRCATYIYKKISMHRRDHRPADLHPFTPALLDETAGAVIHRIFKKRTGIRLPFRLPLPTFSCQGGAPLTYCIRVVPLKSAPPPQSQSAARPPGHDPASNGRKNPSAAAQCVVVPQQSVL